MDPTGSTEDNHGEDSDLYPSITVSRGILPDIWIPDSWRRKRNKRKQLDVT